MRLCPGRRKMGGLLRERKEEGESMKALVYLGGKLESM